MPWLQHSVNLVPMAQVADVADTVVCPAKLLACKLLQYLGLVNHVELLEQFGEKPMWETHDVLMRDRWFLQHQSHAKPCHGQCCSLRVILTLLYAL